MCYDDAMGAELLEQDLREVEEAAEGAIIRYYTSDDGIYLVCSSCPWEKNLGWDPTLSAAIEAAKDHRLDRPHGWRRVQVKASTPAQVSEDE